MPKSVRESVFAGSFYPLNETELLEALEALDMDKHTTSIGTIHALIVPHAGYIYSGKVAMSAYKYLRGKKYDEIFMLGVSHHYPLDYVAFADYQCWRTPLGCVRSSNQLKKNCVRRRYH